MQHLLILLTFLVFACQQKKKIEYVPSPAKTEEQSPSNIIKTEYESENTISPCYYESETASLGIGLVVPIDYTNQTLKIFNNKELSNLLIEIKIYSEKPIEICAKYNKPDYGIRYFVCLEKSDTVFKILVNTSDEKYLSAENSGYKFITWNEYIETAYSVRRKRKYKTKYIFKSANALGEKIKIPEEKFERFCVLKVQGEWINVKYDCFHNKPNNKYELVSCDEFIDNCDNSSGWFKWRDGNNVLVDIPHLP